MFFKKKKESQKKEKRGRRPEPQAASSSSERHVTVHVAEGPGHVGSRFVIPASHLGRPRLALLMARAEAEYGPEHQEGDVVRVPCRHCDFVDAMVWTAVEEAMQGRTAHGAPAPVDDGGISSNGWYLDRPQ